MCVAGQAPSGLPEVSPPVQFQSEKLREMAGLWGSLLTISAPRPDGCVISDKLSSGT